MSAESWPTIEWIAILLISSMVGGLMWQTHSHEDAPLKPISTEEEERSCNLACEYSEPGGYALGWIPDYGCYCADAKQHRWQEN